MLFSFLNVNDCLKALLVSGVCFYSIFLSLSDLQPQCPDGLLPGSGKVTGRSRRIPADTTPEGQGRSPWQRPPWDHHCCHSHQLCAHQHLNKTLSETCPKGQFVLNNDQWHNFIMIKKSSVFSKNELKRASYYYWGFFSSFFLCCSHFVWLNSMWKQLLWIYIHIHILFTLTFILFSCTILNTISVFYILIVIFLYLEEALQICLVLQ